MSNNAARRQAWLELLQQSGPFLTVPVADRIWPAGLPAIPASVRTQLRVAVSELLATSGVSRQEFAELVLHDVLGWDDGLVEDVGLPATLTEVVAERGVFLRPDFAFRFEAEDPADDAPENLAENPDDEDRTLTLSASQMMDSRTAACRRVPKHPIVRGGCWARGCVGEAIRLAGTSSPGGPRAPSSASPRCCVPETSQGLVSDGRWWSLVWAPRGKPVGAAVWDATLWSEEPESLEAFVALLDRRRFLGVPPA